MITRILGVAVALIVIAPMSRAQDDKPDEALVQTLLKNPKTLADALAHCDPKTMTMDRDCRAANEARKRQFFGTGTVPYTPKDIQIFGPGADKPLNAPKPSAPSEPKQP